MTPLIDTTDVFVAILAGGRGTRLWPLSTEERPKQFLSLTGEHLSLLGLTVRRAERIVPRERICVVCPRQQVGMAALHAPGCRVLEEPAGRNTAAANGMAAAFAGAQNENAIVVVLSSDHVIRNEDEWYAAMLAGIQHVISTNRLVTFGIEVTDPDPRYGYIVSDQLLDRTDGREVWSVATFREKPPREEILDLMESGVCRRNTGMFVWRSNVFLDELTAHLPDTSEVVQRMTSATGTNGDESYLQLPAVSVDVGVLQQSKRVSVVHTGIDRLDLGGFNALRELWERDENGNAANSVFTEVDSRNNTVYSDAGRVALVGVDGLVVAVTEDAVLVCHEDQLDRIGPLAKRLSQDNTAGEGPEGHDSD